MITIFNGRGLQDLGVYAQVSVSLREHLHAFRNPTNSNPLSVFLCIALHTDSNGWSLVPRGTIARETGLGEMAITAALKHLRGLRLEGKRVLAHYREVNDGKWGRSIYLLFPETQHGGPPPGWDRIAEQENDESPPPEITTGKTQAANRLYPVGRWQIELFARLRRSYGAKGRKAPQRFQSEQQQQLYQGVADKLGEEEAMRLLDYAMGAKAMTALSQVVAYLHACAEPKNHATQPDRGSASGLELL